MVLEMNLCTYHTIVWYSRVLVPRVHILPYLDTGTSMPRLHIPVCHTVRVPLGIAIPAEVYHRGKLAVPFVTNRIHVRTSVLDTMANNSCNSQRAPAVNEEPQANCPRTRVIRTYSSTVRVGLLVSIMY
jgi:hypothetical protein